MHIGLDTDGFPKCVGFLKPLLTGEKGIMGYRFAMTLLCLTRTVRQDTKNPIVKLNSITDEFTGSKEFTIPRNFIKSFVTHFRLHHEKPIFEEKDIFISTKGGPNGPSTMS
jgi:hypothetical protein